MSLIVGAYYLTPDGDKIRLEMIAKTGINQDIENSNDICIFKLKGKFRSLQSFNFESVMKRTNPPPDWNRFWYLLKHKKYVFAICKDKEKTERITKYAEIRLAITRKRAKQ